MDNKQLMQKADLAVSDLAAGGYLNPEQASAFIRKLIAEPTIIRQARTATMSSPQKEINKIGFGTRILRPAQSGVPLADTDRSKPQLGKVMLNTKEVIAEIHLPYDVVEDNIERAAINEAAGAGPGTISTEGIKGTIIDLIAQRAALDLEELAINGDTTSADPYLQLLDGYMKLANAHTVDAANTAITGALFKAGLKAMPDQYLRNKASLTHYLSYDREMDYREALATRNTSLGDTMVVGTNQVYGYGVPVTPVSLMPNTKGLLVNPMNLIFGIQRQVQIETDKDIRARMYIIVLTARIDFKVEEPDAIVKYFNIAE